MKSIHLLLDSLHFAFIEQPWRGAIVLAVWGIFGVAMWREGKKKES